MLINANEAEIADRSRAKVVIAGGGLAGLLLARELAPLTDIIVIERGDLQLSAKQAELADAHISGIPYPLKDTRDFRLGGSTSIWAGYCAEFDMLDFSQRDWVPHSGWPITLDELTLYKDKVAETLNLTDATFDPLHVTRDAQKHLPPFIPGLTVTAWRFGNPILRIADHWLFDTPELDNLKVITNARVIDIRLNNDQTEVDRFICINKRGEQFDVTADIYILAMGGLETARLLLSSNTQCPYGVANSSGFVGQCFSEHPHMTIDGFEFFGTTPLTSWAEKGKDSAGNPFALCAGLSAQAQENLSILNHRAHIFRTPQMSTIAPPQLGIFLEQAPNRSSRITLAEDRDADGVPKLDLHWTLNELDVQSFVLAANEIGHTLEEAGAGRYVSPLRAEQVTSDRVLHSNHQLGTTRMSENPAYGPLDGNCLTHDHRNLYVAGGSAFPTVSWANPSFMVMLLTMRLAEHLKQRIRN